MLKKHVNFCNGLIYWVLLWPYESSGLLKNEFNGS